MLLISRTIKSFIIIFLLLLSACSTESHVEQQSKKKQPNILYILADDLGYSDLSVYGSEISTPNLDELANQGVMLTNFNANMTCSPTRSMLMSGTDSHLAGLGVMGPSQREDQKNQPGYEAYLNDSVVSLGDLMTDAGYNTYTTGKWHLGKTKETSPKARGFKHSFISLDGAAHLGGLSWNGPGLAPYRDEDELVTVADDFYTTKFYTERMIEYIEADRAENKPFFAYLAYTAPHWPLQAPEASIAKFKGMYDDGYEAIYQQRYNRMEKLGILPKNSSPVNPEVWKPRWNELSEEEKRISSRNMEIYAAMISDLDIYVGQVIDYLKSINEYDNTLIMFMSDNGAQSGINAAPEWVSKCCDNSYENLGKSNSYVMYGENWATVSAAPFRDHKFTAFEGGIHVPAFIAYPKMIEPGTKNNGYSTVMDLLPTFLALAGTEFSGTQYKGKTVYPVRGKSLIPQLTGTVNSVHSNEEKMGWELYGHRGIRQGDWKIVWDVSQGKNAQWMLFNLINDPSEQNDLSKNNPEKLANMITLWDEYENENGVIY